MTKPKTNPRDGKTWPGYVLGGRLRTSTLVLIVAFVGCGWLYQNYEPGPESLQQVPASEVVPPGFIPDPSYTWVPRTDVQRRTSTPTTTTPTTEESPTSSAPATPTSGPAESPVSGAPTPPTASPEATASPAPTPSPGPEPSANPGALAPTAAATAAAPTPAASER